MVSCTPSPGTAAVPDCPAVGISCPRAERSYSSVPAVPASSVLKPYSMPPRPVPSAPTKPTTFAAMSPAG